MSKAAFPVFIGYDPREHEAYLVARASLLANASVPVAVFPLVLTDLVRAGLMPGDRFEPRPTGGYFDRVSGAPAATEFAVSRFLVPALCPRQRCLFVDCDVVFTGDVAELAHFDMGGAAVAVVKHDYEATEGPKMDGCLNVRYQRKNWSSVMLFEPGHPAFRALTPQMVGAARGLYLHGFEWLLDSEIAALPSRWNWLVGEQPDPGRPGIAHYTLGGPWLPGWEAQEADALWLDWYRSVTANSGRFAT